MQTRLEHTAGAWYITCLRHERPAPMLELVDRTDLGSVVREGV